MTSPTALVWSICQLHHSNECINNNSESYFHHHKYQLLCHLTRCNHN